MFGYDAMDVFGGENMPPPAGSRPVKGSEEWIEARKMLRARREAGLAVANPYASSYHGRPPRGSPAFRQARASMAASRSIPGTSAATASNSWSGYDTGGYATGYSSQGAGMDLDAIADQVLRETLSEYRGSYGFVPGGDQLNAAMIYGSDPDEDDDVFGTTDLFAPATTGKCTTYQQKRQKALDRMWKADLFSPGRSYWERIANKYAMKRDQCMTEKATSEGENFGLALRRDDLFGFCNRPASYGFSPPSQVPESFVRYGASYGEEGKAPSTFGNAFAIGAGVGLGFAAVGLGVGALVRALR